MSNIRIKFILSLSRNMCVLKRKVLRIQKANLVLLENFEVFIHFDLRQASSKVA